MQKENRSLEYKEEISSSYLKTVSAFANYIDGKIVFGVTDDLKVVGIADPEQACLNIENQINDSIKPRPDYSLKANADGTISLFVKKGRNTPYRYNEKAYGRYDASTVEVDFIEERRLTLAGANISYEEVACGDEKLEFSCLGNLLTEMLDLEKFDLDTLKSLALYKEKGGYNNAAALLSDKNPFPGVDIIIFGDSVNVLRKRFTFSGESVLKQYFSSLETYKEVYVVERIEGGLRQKEELVPSEAFREALANALVHRTWDVNASIKVEMHPDEVIISSPGGLMADMSKEDYVRGSYSSLRNPILANVFRRLGIIEGFATGIKRINDAYRYTAVKPIYEVTVSAIMVILPVKREIELSENEKKVLDSFKGNRSYSREEIEIRSTFGKDKLVRLLNSLLEKGLIERDGQGRATFYRRK